MRLVGLGPGSLTCVATSTRKEAFPNEPDSQTNTTGKQVAVVVGATSKWQSDGRNTLLAHGKALDDSDLPVGVRWGVGGAIAQKFAPGRFLRRADNPHRGQCVSHWRGPSAIRAANA